MPGSLVAGIVIGRCGQVVNRLVPSAGLRTSVLDHDLEAVEAMRRFGFRGFFGDPTRPEPLRTAGLRSAPVLVVAPDDPEAALRLVRHAPRARPDHFIVACARDRINPFALLQAGADKIVREIVRRLFDASLRAGRRVLGAAGLTEQEADALGRTRLPD